MLESPMQIPRLHAIRRACNEDLSALLALPRAWPLADTLDGAAPRDFETALRDFPEGQFVLHAGTQILAFVSCVKEDEDAIRLIAAYVSPAAPGAQVEELLSLVQRHWTLKGDVRKCLGIEECRAALAIRAQRASLAHHVAKELAVTMANQPFPAGEDPRDGEAEMGKFSFRWLLAILQRIGVMREAGKAYELDELKHSLGIARKYDRYFGALVRRLVAEKLLIVDGHRLVSTALVCAYALTEEENQVAEFSQSFQNRYPASAAMFRFMAACLSRFEEIITGKVDAAEVVFQDGAMDLFAEVFAGDAVSDYFNAVIAESVRSAALHVGGQGRRTSTTPFAKVRILEIGAGTGGATRAMLAALGGLSDWVEFCVSDISTSLLRYTERRLAGAYPWVEYKRFDIEGDVARQGFDAGSWDVIIAANTLHDTRDIEFTLTQVRSLLKPNGLLILNEFTAVKDCLFFSGALLHGYWLFEDPQRRLKDSCLLTVSQWVRALEAARFTVTGMHALPSQILDGSCSQSVILCGPNAQDEKVVPLQPARVPERMQDGGTGSLKEEIVRTLIGQQVMTLLGADRASAYAPGRPLMDIGLDSIEVVELKSFINDRFGVRLASTFLFEHETPEKIATALAGKVTDKQMESLMTPGRAGSFREKKIADADAEVTPIEDAIAIVGVACRFPGGVVSAESFWALLEGGRSGIVSLPAGRWQWPDYIDIADTHKGIDRAGFLNRIDEFDASFFRTSLREAELMDPQQRLLLELSWEAMEDAGHRPSELSGRMIGVFVGVCHGDYREVLTSASIPAEAYVGTGSAYALLANRLSYFHNFKGPSITVDTACSSSLFALHNAVCAIRSGECEQALVGAANLLCSPTTSISYYRAGMLSPTGSCKTFDRGADGYVRGEGGAMLVLKPLVTALAEGDSIYGLVKGTAINHGGQAASLTAPKPEAQAAVIEAAWKRANVPVQSAGYIETHGTGTPLGDPVEISGLMQAFRRLYQDRGEPWPTTPNCGLGSAKSNIGHLESAAGLAGLTKILMSMKHRTLPATLHFEQLNPEIDLLASPFYVVERNHSWPARRDLQGRELPRRAGVSSFGFGGSNAHAVIEEYPVSDRASEIENDQHVIPLSAKSAEQLLEQARRLLQFLESPTDNSSSGEVRLADLAYTLQVGREPMQERLALVIQSRKELIHTLRIHLAGQPAANCFRGQAGLTPEINWRGKPKVADSPADLATLAARWTSGVEIDWNCLHTPGLRRRVHLPAYPFARERYWFSPSGTTIPESAGRANLHPLLQQNTSNLEEQRFSSVFTGQEFFLADHRISGLRVLPAAAYLEMVREAVSRAAGKSVDDHQALTQIMALTNLRWLIPLVVRAQPVEIHIGLFAQQRSKIEFEVYSRTRSSGRTVYARGNAEVRATHEAALMDVETLLRRYKQGSYSAAACYGALQELGMDYGKGHRAIEGLHVEGDEVVARLSLPASRSADRFVLHPGLLDSGLQAIIGFTLASGAAKKPKGVFLPFELREAEIYDAAMPASWAVARRISSNPVSGIDIYNIDLCDEAGRVCVRLRGLSTRWVENWRADLVEREEVRSPEKPQPAVVTAVKAEKEAQTRMRWLQTTSATEHAWPGPEGADSIAIVGMSEMRARVQLAHDRYDIDFCDEYGRVSAYLRGCTTSPLDAERKGVLSLQAPEGGDLILTPSWEPYAIERATPDKSLGSARIAAIGGTTEQRLAVQRLCAEVKYVELTADETSESLLDRFTELGEIEHLLWIVPPHLPETGATDSVISEQSRGVVLGFLLVKALLAAGYAERTFQWTVVTTGVEAVHGDQRPNPTHASVHGFIGSVANEFGDWKMRLFDLPVAGDWPWQDVFEAEGLSHGNALLYRQGSWYRQKFLPYRLLEETPMAIHSGDVYLIVGGHGGIGRAWSEVLLRRAPVQLVWIGRRPVDDVLQAEVDRLAELGPAPLYISADVTDREQLSRVRSTVLQRFGRIDGLVHAAMVLEDHSLVNMTEAAFKAALRPKIDGCVRLAQVFAQEPLRFVLFFSSCHAFIKPAGQSNYVASCTFEDAFARRMAGEWADRVRVINWGYWGSIGAAASEHYRVLMNRKGFGSIELESATRILDELMSGRVVQMAYLRVNQRAALLAFDVCSDEWTTSLRETLCASPGSIDYVPAGIDATASDATGGLAVQEWRSTAKQIDAMVIYLLMSQLHKMGLLEQRKIGHEGVPSSGNISKRFERWLEQSFRLLEGAGYLVRIEDELRVDESAPTDHQAAWEQWKRLKSQWHGDPQWAPTVGLVEALLHALPEVLTGHRAAAEVWFADGFGSSSKPLIAEVVGSGPVSRFCNDTIAHTVVQYIQHRQRQDPHCLLRILEVGAGTGSTTAVVLDAVKPYVRCLKEYACTDNSGAVIAALGRWLPADSGFVTYRTFDVDRSPEAQGIPIGTYDLVIGGNGLHATRDIRNAVRNAKATLKTNGLLLLHESTSNGPLDHLLGLLDEWWLFKDTELRIPGGPALEPESWKFVLQKEGFSSVSFLAQQMHAFGRQVIVSASDGVIRQRLTRPVLTQAGGVEVSTGWDKFEVPAAVIDKTATVDELMRKTRPVAVEQLLAKLRLHTAKTLGVDAATLDAQTRAFADMLLSELGMDSLSSNDLRSTLRQELGVDIPVQRIIGEKALAIAEALYDEILIRRITVESANIDEERETFVF